MQLEKALRRLPTPVNRSLHAVGELILNQPHPVLVYQMSKVGSTSVSVAMRRAGIRSLHVHFLGDAYHDARNVFRSEGRGLPLHFYRSALLRPYLKATSHRVKIISLVRDPIARQVSTAFQAPWRSRYNATDADQMTAQLFREFSDDGILNGCYTWFDKELKVVFGIDVFTHEFDRERGFARFSEGRADVLILKLEKLDQLWPTISDFLGVAVEPTTSNTAGSKETGSAYAETRSNFRLPRRKLEKLYDHPWMRHFYTDDEVERFMRKWENPGPGSQEPDSPSTHPPERDMRESDPRACDSRNA